MNFLAYLLQCSVINAGCRMNRGDDSPLTIENFDPCVYQTEECRSLLCQSQIKNEDVEQCRELCERSPMDRTVTTIFFGCHCIWLNQRLCLKAAPLTIETTTDPTTTTDEFTTDTAADTTPSGQESTLPSASIPPPSLLWGVAFHDDENNLLVFCVGQPGGCTNLLPGLCVPGRCNRTDECWIDGECLHLEWRIGKDVSCRRGVPAALKSDSALANFAERSWTGLLGKHVVATDGFVAAKTSSLEWRNHPNMSSSWVDGLIQGPQDEDRVVTGIHDLEWGSFEKAIIVLANLDNLRVNALELQVNWTLCTGATTAINTLPVSHCNSTDPYGSRWTCKGNSTCWQNCPNGASGEASWECGAGGIYLSLRPNYTSCRSLWVDDLQRSIDNGQVNPIQILERLDEVLGNSNLFGHELLQVLTFTQTSLNLLLEVQLITEMELPRQLHQRKFLTDLAMRTVDNMFSLVLPIQQLSPENSVLFGSKIIEISENYGFAVTDKALDLGMPYNVTNHLDNFYMEAQFISQPNQIVRFPARMRAEMSSVEIKPTDVGVSAEGKFLQVESVGSHIPANFAQTMFPAHQKNDSNKELNSGVVSLTIRTSGDEIEIHQLGPNAIAVITFKHVKQAKGPVEDSVYRDRFTGEEPTAIQGTAICVYWKRTPEGQGAWDTSGCRVVSSSAWETVCECSHLSSFALLMDVHKFVGASPALKTLGIVCASLSIISLALTFVFLHVLRNRRFKRGSFINMHLVLCLMFAHLLALLVLDKSYFHMPQELCVFFGGFLHFLFLAAFAWMSVEGHRIYLKLVVVFDTGQDFSKIYLGVGYGIPACIVAATAIAGAALGDVPYANDELCWLSTPGYIWAFIGPAIFIILLNIVVLIIAFRVVVNACDKNKENFSNRLTKWTRCWFSLSALLGATWILGMLLLPVEPVVAYIFVLLNGCQGVFIFLTRVVFDKRAHEVFGSSWKTWNLSNPFK